MAADDKPIHSEPMLLSEAWVNFADLLKPNSKQEIKDLRRTKFGRDDDAASFAAHRLAWIEYELQWELVYKVFTEEFSAFGIDPAERADPKPQKLAAVFFDRMLEDFEPNFENSTIRVDGRLFIDVRISPTSISEVASPTPTKKRGRPSEIGDAIREACLLAVKDDPDFFDRRPSHALPVVADLIAQMPNRPRNLKNGPNNKTFNKIFNKLRHSES